MATRHIVQSSLKVQDGISFFFKTESAEPIPFLPHWWWNHQISMEADLTYVGKAGINYSLQNNPITPKTSPCYPVMGLYPLHPNTHSTVLFSITIGLSFWEYHRNRITGYVTFSEWLFSPSKMPLKFIQVLCASIVSSFLLQRCLVFHYMKALWFVYPFAHWRTFPVMSDYKQGFYKYSYIGVFMWT